MIALCLENINYCVGEIVKGGLVMVWDEEVVKLATEIEIDIMDGHKEKALINFRKLKVLTHIDPPPNLFSLLAVPAGPHFGTAPLPDENW